MHAFVFELAVTCQLAARRDVCCIRTTAAVRCASSSLRTKACLGIAAVPLQPQRLKYPFCMPISSCLLALMLRVEGRT